MKPMVRFDDSLSILAAVIRSELGPEALRRGTVLRDASGQLAFFSATPVAEDMLERVAAQLREALGAYARADRVIASADDYGVATVNADPSALEVRVSPSGERVRLVDRRLVGADWLRAPSPLAPLPPRIVFASVKGGVGRSTALAVTAAHLAARGKRVLAVDLDMEAPGLGALLLTRQTLPPFGMIDALVERGLSGLDESFFTDLVGPSALAVRAGRIDVLPAIGERSLENPADVLAKIARAYVEKISAEGDVATLLDQIRGVIEHFSDPARYDAILVDARAGLHETSAAAVLGLGAEVLLFGLHEPQTFQGYALLLSHLARFLQPGAPLPGWAERLTMVQAKAPADAGARADFAVRCRELFETSGFGAPALEASGTVPLPAAPFSNVPWDDSISDEALLPPEGVEREPLAILNDAQYHQFDPQAQRDLLSDKAYGVTFGELIDRVDALIDPPRGAS